MQRIIVKNFGPLKDIDLEIKDFMIFIGPQASGKSTLAKLIYFFREYENTVKPLLFKNHNQSHDFTKNEHEQLLNHRFSDLFGDYTFSNETLIYFDFGSDNKLNQSITIFYNSEIKLFISNINIEKIFKQINEELNDDRISSLKIVFGSEEVNLGKRKNDIIAFAGLIIETLGKSHLFNNYFIPSNRAFIAQNYAPLTTDSMMYNFYILVGELKNKFRKNYSQQIEEKKYFNQGKLKNKRILKLYLKLLRSVLKGEYILENQNDFIQLDDNIKLNLRSAASGQQESIWVMNAIFYLLLENNESKIIIEEPEAHLYPEAQKDMTYLISLLANQESNQVVITTHSPYILASLNNLIYAYKKGQIDPETVEKVIPKELWINPERLFVGEMQNGEIKEIMHPETGLIEVERLDRVSEDLGEDFEKLYEIHEPTLSV